MRNLFTLFIALFLFVSPAFSLDYFWVGGSGNWSDISHWATTSGGGAFHPVVPSANDNVIFDANSGFTPSSKTVTVNVTANCLNMDWTGAANNPVLNSSGGTLNIYGSLTLTAGMAYSVATNFLSSASETITSAGVSMGGGITFNNTTGSWTLQDALTTSFQITLNSGTLNTNNQTVNTTAFQVNAGTTLNLGSSVINVSVSWLSGTATVNAGTSVINMTGSGNSFTASTGQTYYDLNFTATSGKVSLSGAATFHDVSFAADADIFSAYTYNNLTFAPSHNYGLPGGSGGTQTINGIWTAVSPPCSGLMKIFSRATGTQARIVMPASATANIDYARIQDINASGGATFNATNSVDLGNNTGIIFTSPSAQTLYWVGGSGNWNDASHWSLTSGGPGGACIPIESDDVFFDANSGFTAASKTVTVNSPGAYCHNMTWTGALNNPAFTGSQRLTIYGSMTLTPGMSYNVPTTFASSTAETITSAGVSMGGGITFDNTTGSWTLQDALTTSFQITLNKGTLNTNNQTVNTTAFQVNAGTTLNLGSSVINVSVSWLSGTATVNAGTSVINMTGSGNSFTASTGQTYYDLNFTATSGKVSLSGAATFHDVSFAADADIFSAYTYNNLTFAPSHNYGLPGGSGGTQTINGIWTAVSPPCSGLMKIFSRATGTQARIVMPASATANIDYARIQDINASGGATFNATNSVDLGNNTGIIFTSPSAQTLYWVGGSGNWNDASHWSLTSGGPGGACIPIESDDVFFDANSGFTAASKTVTVNSPGAYCHNMTWTGALNNPAFTGSQRLTIYGSMTLIPGMSYNVPTTFASSTAETITSAGVSMGGGITFDNTTGSWTLQDALTTSFQITLNKGTLNTNNQTVNTTAFQVNAGTTLNLGSSVINVSVSWLSGTATVNAGTSVINMTGNSFTASSGQIFNNLNFTNEFGSATLSAGSGVTFNAASFAGNATIFSSNTFDTLIFNAGKTYSLGVGQTQTVNERLYASGNPCFILFLQSNAAGTRANLCVNGGPTDFDYVNVKDINASCSALRAEGHSTDAGNNLNWTFAPATTNPIEGLGKDTTFSACNPTPFPYTLSTANFFPNPTTTFLWNDGSTDSTLVVTDTATYTITVNYGTTCTVMDTIHLQMDACVPVPVIIEWIEGKGENCQVKIDMKVGLEEQILRYELQQSFDGVKFTSISNQEPLGPESLYHFTALQEKPSAFYRVRIVNKDGVIEYSSILKIDANCDQTDNSIHLYPVPSSNRSIINARFNSPVSGNATLIATDMNGRTVFKRTISITTGQNLIAFPVTDLKAEIYTIKIIANGWTSKNARMVITGN